MRLTGPIPGENYTSDTRNYPWHRPPEYTDIDKAIDASAKQLMSEEGSAGLLAMLHAGMDIATLTDIFVTSGIGAGKWTPDFALLLAGPVSHIIYLMAKGYDIDCDLGIDLKRPPITKAFFDEVKVDQQKIKQVSEALDDPEVQDMIHKKVGGFMGMVQNTEPSIGDPKPEVSKPSQEQPSEIQNGDLE